MEYIIVHYSESFMPNKWRMPAAAQYSHVLHDRVQYYMDDSSQEERVHRQLHSASKYRLRAVGMGRK